MNFFIYKDATYPYLKFGLTSEMLRNNNISINPSTDVIAVTFSMFDDSGNPKILNVSGDFEVNEDYNYKEIYFLVFKFKQIDTDTPGVYLGEFLVDILDKDLKLKFPLYGNINIYVKETNTKSEVSKIVEI